MSVAVYSLALSYYFKLLIFQRFCCSTGFGYNQKENVIILGNLSLKKLENYKRK